MTVVFRKLAKVLCVCLSVGRNLVLGWRMFLGADYAPAVASARKLGVALVC